MNQMMLNTKELAMLKAAINGAEERNGNSYAYQPAAIQFACTCQGNCDGKTSGCTWG